MASAKDQVVFVTVDELLRFFDGDPRPQKNHENRKDSNSVIAVAGEELGLVLFRDYIESEGGEVVFDPSPVTIGSGRGPWLDKWIRVRWRKGKEQLFQAEIKNWNAHGLHGRRLALDAPIEKVREFMIERWNEEWNSRQNSLKKETTLKVLTLMRPPESDRASEVAPLIIYWFAIHPEGDPKTCFFPHPVSSKNFKELYFFSMSSYLRGLKKKVIRLDMPVTRRRISRLRKLFSTRKG